MSWLDTLRGYLDPPPAPRVHPFRGGLREPRAGYSPAPAAPVPVVRLDSATTAALRGAALPAGRSDARPAAPTTAGGLYDTTQVPLTYNRAAALFGFPSVAPLVNARAGRRILLSRVVISSMGTITIALRWLPVPSDMWPAGTEGIFLHTAFASGAYQLDFSTESLAGYGLWLYASGVSGTNYAVHVEYKYSNMEG